MLNRYQYIDVCKAIGIVLVVLGHTHYIPNTMFILIYAFHMPLFFMLSGFVHNVKKNEALGFKNYVVKKSIQLLLPYLILSLVNLLIEVIWRLVVTKQEVNSSYFITKLKGIAFCFSDAENMPNCTPLWFLVCLFVASLIFWWLIKIKVRYALVVVGLSVVINYLILPIAEDNIMIPWKFPTFLVATFFMYLGYLLKQVLEQNKTFFDSKRILTNTISTVAIFVSLVLVAITDNLVSMARNQYGNYLVFLVTSILISISIIMLARNITILENKYVLWLGKNTMYIIAFNYVCRDIANELYYLIPILRNYTIHWSVLFIMTLMLCIICIIICSKIEHCFDYLVHKHKR